MIAGLLHVIERKNAPAKISPVSTAIDGRNLRALTPREERDADADRTGADDEHTLTGADCRPAHGVTPDRQKFHQRQRIEAQVARGNDCADGCGHVFGQSAVAMDADIVALPETTIETGEQVALAMRELGHRMWAHHAEDPSTEWDAGSTTLLISPELGDYAVIESSLDGSSNTSTVPSAVAMPVSGDGPIVVAAHAVAPRPSYMQSWRDDLQWLADQCGDGNVIMAGDFNATVDHMTGLGVDGGTLGHCADAAVETGNGALGTWSSQVPAILGAPIDHVMATSHWRATGSLVLRALDDSGSDHRPLIVQYEPAG